MAEDPHAVCGLGDGELCLEFGAVEGDFDPRADVVEIHRARGVVHSAVEVDIFFVEGIDFLRRRLAKYFYGRGSGGGTARGGGVGGGHGRRAVGLGGDGALFIDRGDRGIAHRIAAHGAFQLLPVRLYGGGKGESLFVPRKQADLRFGELDGIDGGVLLFGGAGDRGEDGGGERNAQKKRKRFDDLHERLLSLWDSFSVAQECLSVKRFGKILKIFFANSAPKDKNRPSLGKNAGSIANFFRVY